MICIIAAVAANGVIGAGGRIPWSIPEDMAYFRRITMGGAVVMGRLTYESIGRPLPGRLNIVVTRSKKVYGDGIVTAGSLPEAIAIAEGAGKDVFICGGGSVYREGLAFAERLYITELRDEYAGDVRFPAFDHRKYRLIKREVHSDFGFSFCIYERK
ncbi:MAG: dihydrofolate reductase [Ruminococcus sp.]|nr:dihydrofolate reductase [Ruminococcus sp.]